MKIIEKLKRAIGLAEQFEKEGGKLDAYKRELVHNAKKKLKGRQREKVQKKSRRTNQKRGKGKRWRGR